MSSGLVASPASTRHPGGGVVGPGAPDVAPKQPGSNRRRRRTALIAVGGAVIVAFVALTVQLGKTTQERDRSIDRYVAARTQLLGHRIGLQHQTVLARNRIDAVVALVDDTTARLEATAAELLNMTTSRDDLLKMLETTGDELRSTAAELGSTQTELDQRTLRLSETQRCLHGVQDALERAAVDDFGGAVRTLESVRRPCDVALDRNQAAIGGPVLDASFADPYLLRTDGGYVAYGTNSVGGAIQMAAGPDLSSLTLRGPAVAALPKWAKAGNTWAPSILQRGDRWALYYTVAERTQGSCLAVATGPTPIGPFRNEPIALTCRRDLGGSIDPSPAVGRDGRAWLVWKVEGVRGRHPAQIVSQQLSEDGRHLLGVPVTLVPADQRWEEGVVEGPSLVQRNDRWVLLYSGGNWRTAGYGIGAAACDGPLGPCRKVASGPIHRPVDPLTGAGGQELFVGPDGGTWLTYHAWVRGQVGYPNPRRLYVARIDLDQPIPRVTPVPITAT